MVTSIGLNSGTYRQLYRGSLHNLIYIPVDDVDDLCVYICKYSLPERY